MLTAVQSSFAIRQEFDRLLPLAKAGVEKPLCALCLAYIAALEKVIDSCVLSFDKVNCSHYFLIHL